MFADFKRIAGERAAGRSTDRNTRVTSLTIGELIRDLRPDQLWKVAAALVGLFSALAAGAFWLGKHL